MIHIEAVSPANETILNTTKYSDKDNKFANIDTKSDSYKFDSTLIENLLIQQDRYSTSLVSIADTILEKCNHDNAIHYLSSRVDLIGDELISLIMDKSNVSSDKVDHYNRYLFLKSYCGVKINLM